MTTGHFVRLQEPHVQRDKERLAKKLDAPKETFVMPEVSKYDGFHKARSSVITIYFIYYPKRFFVDE